MGNVYHAFDLDYELYVEESSAQKYYVVMKVYAEEQPVVLHAYSTKVEAIAAAQAFPKLYRTARLKGFELNGQYFEHPSGKSVHVSFAMEPGASPDKFMKILI